MFGSHYCEPHTFDYNIVYPEKYQYALKGYYDAIFGPFKPYVLQGMEKIAELEIERICTSHGPILTKGCMMQNVMVLRVYFTIFYSAFCANCLLSTSRSSSCMIATILAHSANSIFPLV